MARSFGYTATTESLIYGTHHYDEIFVIDCNGSCHFSENIFVAGGQKLLFWRPVTSDDKSGIVEVIGFQRKSVINYYHQSPLDSSNKRPVKRSFIFFMFVSMNKLINKWSGLWWFQISQRSYDITLMIAAKFQACISFYESSTDVYARWPNWYMLTTDWGNCWAQLTNIKLGRCIIHSLYFYT